VAVWIFRAHDRQDLEALLLMVSQLAWLGGIITCAAMHAPLSWFLATAAAAFLLRTALGLWIVTGRLYRPVFAPRWESLRRLSRAWQLGPAAVRPMLRRAVKFQFLAALPLMVGLFLLAPRVVPLLLKGEDFRRAALALEVMSLGLPLIFLNLMSRYVLTAFD